MLDGLATEQAIAALTPPATMPPLPRTFPSGLPEGELPTGVLEHVNSFRPYHFSNGWATLGEQYVTYYAGRRLDESAFGTTEKGVIVRVRFRNPGGLRLRGADQFDAPAGAGMLRIESADGTLLTISSASGATFVFDIGTETFTLVEATPSPVVTATPWPSKPPRPACRRRAQRAPGCNPATRTGIGARRT
jgi:hypothetical protein